MALYIAYNAPFDATTGVTAGTQYTTGAKCAIQLATPSTVLLRIVEYSVSFNGSAAATPATVTLVQAGAASTMSTAHTTSTVVAIGDSSKTSSLTMGTTATGYGNGSITTNTTSKEFDAQFISPTAQFVKQWPLGREPVLPASSFCQLRINTSATVNALAYIVFEEC
ncbi:hypothetical protein [Streptomyces sp. SAJ15]|uniref:hypothetical protein n=1 Tax=Streptomyces sp. SAJ15 TaxID=2011095 RepID=UPI0011872D35|nr:hypothetical protein [Streptomyces sp. SAJ15]